MKVVTIKAEIQTPRVPNFIRMTDGQILPVSAIDDSGLMAIAQAWKEDLLANAQRQREGGCSKDKREMAKPRPEAYCSVGNCLYKRGHSGHHSFEGTKCE